MSKPFAQLISLSKGESVISNLEWKRKHGLVPKLEETKRKIWLEARKRAEKDARNALPAAQDAL